VTAATNGRYTLPLPRFVFHPATSLSLAGIHVYLSSGHLAKLFGGPILWTDVWKGIGALAGAYVFAALASRALAGRRSRSASSATV
jgi:hypothetical protein